MKCYDSLPRPPGVDTFFVHAQEGAARWYLPASLRPWNKQHINSRYTHATVNLYMTHALLALTELATREKVKEARGGGPGGGYAAFQRPRDRCG